MGVKPKKQKKKLEIKINLQQGIQDSFSLSALIDSGAEGNFIDKDLVDNNGLKTFLLERKVNVYNVDGTPNASGSITLCVVRQL